MTDQPDQNRPRPPIVPAPPRFVDRRVAHRRAKDRVLARETTLLARSLDILAGPGDADGRLAGVLDLLARTAGAMRAAVVVAGTDRRVVVAVDPDEDPAGGTALASWLDAAAPRSRAQRAASAPAAIAVVTGEPDPAIRAERRLVHHGEPVYAALPVRGTGDVTLGFQFRDEATAQRLGERLPGALARHAAVALSLVTGQLAMERELGMLQARDAERARFISTVAHELRTPLTGLSGYLDLILEGRVDDPAVAREFLERGRTIVDTMGELVGDLLELSRLDSGSLQLEIGPFSVADATSRVAAGLMPVALERGTELRTRVPPRLRAANGDRRRFEQILTNLVGNALKFSAPGSTVELAAWFEGPTAVVAVRDEGPGVAAEERERIFDRFYRMSGHERVTGTGLGLPIARDLARTMGGDLGVASVPGSGSSFVLVLAGPAQIADDSNGDTLAGVLEAEEVGLEERAVLRAIHLAERSAPVRGEPGRPTRPDRPVRPRPMLVPNVVPDPEGDDEDAEAGPHAPGRSTRPA